MADIIINSAICVGCGECAADCVANNIEIVEGKARLIDERCIACGHCYAICPVSAVSMKGAEAADGIKLMSDYDGDEFLLALKSRRSVRRFTDEAVSQEDILKIIEAGRYCPTACNAQDVGFVILDKLMDECQAAGVKAFRKMQRLAAAAPPIISNAKIDDDFFFKGAPVAILTVSKSSLDAALASSYMELMAESLGLGVFYSGFFVAATKYVPAVKKLLDLPEGSEVVTCLVIGHSDVKYRRIVPRKLSNLLLR